MALEDQVKVTSNLLLGMDSDNLYNMQYETSWKKTQKREIHLVDA